MKNFILGIVVTLLLVGIAGGAYYFGSRSAPEEEATPTFEPTAPSDSQYNLEVMNSPAPQTSDKSYTKLEVQAAILNAVSTKKYADLKEYILPQVEVVKYATECCGTLTQTEAFVEMKYLDAATPPWVFDINNAKIKNLKTTYPQYYKTDSITGISNNGYIASFDLDENNMIQKVVMSVSLQSPTPAATP
jgi:hypothetical protein